jgi:hypothetical protein
VLEIPRPDRQHRRRRSERHTGVPALLGAAMKQLDPIGLIVRCQQKPCPDCRCVDCLIGMGDELVCFVCDRHRGRLSKLTHNFICESIRNFGRPSEPIQLRIKNSSASDEATATATAVATQPNGVTNGLR